MVLGSVNQLNLQYKNHNTLKLKTIAATELAGYGVFVAVPKKDDEE